MCWKTVTSIFKPKPVELPVSEPLSLPHPEEARDPNATTVDVPALLQRWLDGWGVPEAEWAFWRSIQIEAKPLLSVVYNGQVLSVPAATYSEERRMELDPTWANPGVVSHELCHISYSLLSEEEKTAFAVAFEAAKSDPLVTLLFEQHPYGEDNPVEGHADIYRFLGGAMPESLKTFYPKLLEDK